MSFNSLLHSCYYLISLYSFYVCLSLAAGESVAFNNVDNDKDITISAEELLRRRMLVQEHLTKYEEKQKDWIETYHLSYSDSDFNFINKAMSKHTVSEVNTANDILISEKKTSSSVGSKEIEREPTSYHNSDDPENNLPSAKDDDSPSRDERTKIGSDRSNNIEIGVSLRSFDETDDAAMKNQNFEKFTNELKNDLLSPVLTDVNNEVDNSKESISKVMNSEYRDNSVLKEEVSKSVYLTMQTSAVSFSGNLEKTAMPDSDIKFDSDSDIPIPIPNKILQSVYEESSDIIVDVPRKNPILKNYISRADSVQLTDSKSHTVSSHQIEYSLNDMKECPNILKNFKNIILSYSTSPHGKMTDAMKSNLVTNLRNSESNYFSQCIESNKQNYIIPGLDSKTNHDKNIEQISGHHMSKGEKNSPNDFIKTDYILSKETFPSVSDELLKRKRLIKPFISSLNEKNEKWRETYDFSDDDLNSVEGLKSFQGSQKTGKKLHSKTCGSTSAPLKATNSVERYYIKHWLKRLHNKLVYYHDVEEIKISLSLSSNILKDLEELISSETFDVSEVDEFLSGVMKNATVVRNYDTYDFSTIYNSVGFYITVSIMLSVLTYLLLLYFPITRIVFPIVGLLVWHGWKMYSEKVAKKHAVLSSTAPEYCQNILTVESGVIAHFKEFIRSAVHDDQCHEYFQALMTDPLSELSLPIVVSDFISSTFLQFFHPLGRTLNIFIKDSFSDLGIISSLYLFILIIILLGFGTVLLMIYRRYKINFPFSLGSAEPTAIPTGSRVEDLPIKPSDKKQYFLQSFVSNKYEVSIASHSKHLVSSDKSLTFHQFKKLKALDRRLSI